MGFWENIKFAFSSEYLELRKLLIENSKKYPADELAAVLNQLLEGQDSLGRVMISGFDEVQALRAELDQVKQILEEDRRGKTAQDEEKLTKEELEQMISAAMEHAANEKNVNTALKEQDSRIYSYYQTVNAKLDEIRAAETEQGKIQRSLLSFAEQWVKTEGPSAQDQVLKKRIQDLEGDLERERSKGQVLANQNLALRADIQKLEKALKEKTPKPKPPKADSNPYLITANKAKYLIDAGDRANVVSRLGNTIILEKFFQGVPSDNTYNKMYQRYKNTLRKCMGAVTEDDEMEDIMESFVSVVYSDFLKKIMVAVYNGRKRGQSQFEDELLGAANRYLESAGFYTRDNIQVGDMLKDGDYEDMEFLKDESVQGKRKMEITEIELYPYYINYVDEEGEKRAVHTQGLMIIAA